ncbi:DUF3429 domain-containing protein [Roseibium sediminis]|uniref:DUF3429 domain-containing protein n=1 Tax=Roseibium sediminis TaxID=1775174 RepID=UPI00123D6FFF|nr:DUF3429 domain-containing protein [Roseibium sediminis]
MKPLVPSEDIPAPSDLAAPSTTIPQSALWLTASGYIPFAILSLASLLAPAPFQPQIGIALLLYGAIILSFLGGIHWGVEMAHGAQSGSPPNLLALAISTAPSLIAWASLALPHPFHSVGLGIGFLLILTYDLRCKKTGRVPDWYPKLRIPVTLAVLVALLVPNAF